MENNRFGEWRDVRAERPETEAQYLCAYRFQGMGRTYFQALSYDVVQERFQHEGYAGLQVLYWMPIPRLPVVM